jgi:hypothetical protein
MDGSGNALVVWYQADFYLYSEGPLGSVVTSGFNVYANRYTAGAGWHDATTQLNITDDGGTRSEPQIAMDDEGNAMVVWHDYSSTGPYTSSNRFEAGSGWQGQQRSPTVPAVGHLQIAMNNEGKAITIASRDNQIGSIRYEASNGWEGSGWDVTGETNKTPNRWLIFKPKIAIDNEGNAIAVWQQLSDDEKYTVWANRSE